ncbi:hypothetical protein B7R22_18065 [Subtercola boreus]|uniref:HEPN AbiU2-like domain-containing protein n=2 Tax=Subtercola boreus TaxID=120213 RepID=A0A3E0VPB5_9MICO|nr:hypothetical protein B7R22_18065 [Subtercola boreus]
MRRDVPERDAISYGYDLAIYSANSRLETIALLLARLEVPAARHVWDRHLVVYLYAAIEAYPQLAGKLIRECQRLTTHGQTVVDYEAVRAAHKDYKKGVALLPKEFMEALERVRNTGGAHHLTTPHSGIDGLIESIEEQMNSDTNAFDPLLKNALTWSMRAITFGQESFAALHVTRLPAIPGREEYLRLVKKLDDEQVPETDPRQDDHTVAL